MKIYGIFSMIGMVVLVLSILSLNTADACSPKGEEGDRCIDDRSCEEGLTCIKVYEKHGDSVRGTPRCIDQSFLYNNGPRTEGHRCSDRAPCEEGLTCTFMTSIRDKNGYDVDEYECRDKVADAKLWGEPIGDDA